MNKKEKIKQLRNKNGITLIALVVTIIVLIILASVSIGLVLGDNGIIEKAKEGKQNTELAKVEEEVQLNEAVEYLENLGGSSTPTIKPGESGYEGGSYDDPYIPVGFTHTEGTWNGGYTIKDELGNEFVWVPCVTDSSKIKDGDNVEIFKKTLPSTTDTTDSYYMYNRKNYTITGDENPASNIRTSVGIYGGFYIAKYEAGVPLDEDGNEIAPTLATTSQKARSVSGATVWTNITRTNAIIATENMIDVSSGVKSGLISSECWDTTLQWMVNTSDNATENAGYDINSRGNGWYNDVSSSKKTTSGQYPINNIYDMAGNIWEWTTENCTYDGNSYLVTRGGNYDNSGSDVPVSYRNNSNNSAVSYIAMRVVLYK